jgi:hypothetical protein
MKRMIKFPSIEQFRNVIRNVEHTAQYVGQIGNRVLKQSNDGNGVHAQTYHLQTTSDSFHFQATIRPTSFGAADGRINLWFSHADANNTFFLSISSYSLQFIKKEGSWSHFKF